MKILVTGSRGFVGGSFGRHAARAGHELWGIARSSQPDITWVGKHIQADVAQTNLSNVINEFRPDMVFHGAGSSSVKSSIEAPLEDLRAAVMTWTNTLEGIRRSSCRPLIVFPSSAAVYGNPLTLPIKESDLTSPISPYGFHKQICETIGKEYAQCFALNITVARIFSLFGVAQRRLLVWELFEQMQDHSNTVWLQGTGLESRDYLHIDDFCELVLSLAKLKPKQQKGEYMILNAASGTETYVADVARNINELFSLKNKEICCHGNSLAGDPQRWCADVSVVQKLLKGWKPRSFELGLQQCIDEWRQEIIKI